MKARYLINIPLYLKINIFLGDMKNGDRMLNWLLTQKDPSADVIEEVEGKELLELIEVAEHLAVFFCMIFFKHIISVF